MSLSKKSNHQIQNLNLAGHKYFSEYTLYVWIPSDWLIADDIQHC